MKRYLSCVMIAVLAFAVCAMSIYIRIRFWDEKSITLNRLNNFNKLLKYQDGISDIAEVEYYISGDYFGDVDILARVRIDGNYIERIDGHIRNLSNESEAWSALPMPDTIKEYFLQFDSNKEILVHAEEAPKFFYDEFFLYQQSLSADSGWWYYAYDNGQSHKWIEDSRDFSREKLWKYGFKLAIFDSVSRTITLRYVHL